MYIDGKLIQKYPFLTFQFPQGNKPMLTLGNSVYGEHSWMGDVYALAFFAYELSPETIESHNKRFKDAGFEKIDIWQKWFNFTSFICQK